MRVATAIVIGIFLCLNILASESHAQWYVSYRNGLAAAEQQDWLRALNLFREAAKVNGKDTKKIRTRGTIFIEYYPNREIGVCLYHLGEIERAKKALQLSLSQTFSAKARMYLNRINRGQLPPNLETPPPPVETPPEVKVETPPETKTEPPPEEKTEETPATSFVGERLSIAALPFESKGIGGVLGQIDLLDKIITGFVNINRFKIIERAQLEKILEEQSLGMSGVIDISTAAQIGKGIGVDAVLVGSVTQSQNAAGIDARLIDTETAAIITARDAFANTISLQSLSQMISELAEKIKSDFPIVNGYVIGVTGDKITIDIGHQKGIRKGTKCHVYREGAPIIHPVSNEVISKMIDMVCEIQVTEIYDAYAIAVVTKSIASMPSIRDKVITK